MRRNYLHQYMKPSNESENVQTVDGKQEETPVVKAPDAEEGALKAETAPKEVNKEAPTDGEKGNIAPTDEGKVEQGEAGGPTKEAPLDGQKDEIAPTGEGAIKAEATSEETAAAKADAPTGEIVPTEEGEIAGSVKVDIDVTEVEFEMVSNTLKETEVAVKDDQEIKATAEALEGYADELRHLIATETYTTGTARILENAINVTLNNMGGASNRISLESHGVPLSVKGKHEHMLENISMEANVLHDVAQSFVMQFKHHWNAMADFLRGVDGKSKKYGAKIDAAAREFEGKKSKWQARKVKVGMTELWYHFSTAGGKVKDVMGAVAADVALTKYILGDYTSQLLQMTGNLAQVCQSSNLSTPEGVAKFVQQLERFKHPADLFNASLIKGKSYLSVTHLDIETGKARKPIDFNGQPLTKLAELATPRKVVEAGSGMHTAKKIGAYVASAAVNQAAGMGVLAKGGGIVAQNAVGAGVVAANTKIASADGDMEINAQDIGKLLAFAGDYLHMVDQYTGQEKKYEAVANNLIKAIAALGKTATEKVAKQIVKQVDDFATLLMFQNFAHPAHAEIHRALKGAKYCHYLALRAIYNAEHTKGMAANPANVAAKTDGATKAPAGKPIAPTKK